MSFILFVSGERKEFFFSTYVLQRFDTPNFPSDFDLVIHNAPMPLRLYSGRVLENIKQFVEFFYPQHVQVRNPDPLFQVTFEELPLPQGAPAFFDWEIEHPHSCGHSPDDWLD